MMSICENLSSMGSPNEKQTCTILSGLRGKELAGQAFTFPVQAEVVEAPKAAGGHTQNLSSHSLGQLIPSQRPFQPN